MTSFGSAAAPRLDPLKPGEGLRFREYLSNAGYTLENLGRDIPVSEWGSVRAGILSSLQVRFQEPTEINLLARLFFWGVSVPRNLARGLIPAWVIELALRSGMLVKNGPELVPTVMLSQPQALLVASDRLVRYEDSPEDVVIWPNPTSFGVSNATIRGPFESALDLGCGSGVIALTLALHSKKVTATDVNPRAAAFTAFNAALNGFDHIECAVGDRLEPLRGRTFDLIVSNPPFFISPPSEILFCENAMDLDLFCRQLAREAPACLNEGGFFQMLCEWVEVEGQSWRERLAEWFEGSGCDVWTARTSAVTTDAYCEMRGKSSMKYFREKNVTMVHCGVITMRRRHGDNWIHLEEDLLTLDRPVGNAIANEFFSRELLRRTDEELLDERPKLYPEAALNHRFRPASSSWGRGPLKLALHVTTPRELNLDPLVATFVARFNGERSLRDLAGDLAREVGVDPDRVRSQCVAVVRRLAEKGFLDCDRPLGSVRNQPPTGT